MKRIILTAIILILSLPLRLLAQEISLTVEEAVAIALRDNRDVLLKTEDIKKAKAEIAEAEAALFPSLSFTGSRTRTRGLYAKDLNQTTAQFTLKQYLYKGGKTINTIKQNKFSLEVSQHLLDKEKLELIYDVQKAFYTLLLAEEFAQLNKEILENSRAHTNFIKERYEKGEVPESDTLNIGASLSAVGEAYQLSLNEIESTQALLKSLLYLDEAVRIIPNAQFKYEPLEAAYDQTFLKAMAKRPEIKQYEAQLQADKKAIEVAKSDTRPNIYASWDYYSRSTTSLTFSPGKAWQDYNILGLTFSWPIFDGWATRHKVEQAIIDLKETQLTKEKTTKDIALELKNAYLALKNALDKIKAQEADLLVWQDKLKTIKEKYSRGEASSLGLEDANLAYKVASFKQRQAIYDYILAHAGFEKASGGG